MGDSEVFVCSRETLDDVMNETFKAIMEQGDEIQPRRGAAKELSGVVLRVTNPLARISRTESRAVPFSCLGELCWYLSGSDSLSFIEYYIPVYRDDADAGALGGAYGPRLFDWKGIHQFRSALDLLDRHSDSRRAVIQLYDAKDLVDGFKDVPCTCSFQFMIRENRLNMITHMRSNDAYLGLPHDVFCFTMLQEIAAKSLVVHLGNYIHMVGSLHIYQKDFRRATTFLKEGFQPTKGLMGGMPEGNPWPAIDKLLESEEALRVRGEPPDTKLMNSLDDYWADLIRLLYIFRLTRKEHEFNQARRIRDEMSSEEYHPFIDNYIERRASRETG